jgi:hypothetical protein
MAWVKPALKGRHRISTEKTGAALSGLVPQPSKPGVSPRALLLRAFSAGIFSPRLKRILSRAEAKSMRH